MIDSPKWESLFDKNFVSANTSGYTLKKVYGFDEKRTTNWKNNIKEHELFICDILLAKFNNAEESFISNKTYSVNEIAKNLEIISKYPIFYNALQKYNLDKEGNDQHVLDPVKPENWDSDKSESGKFIDSEDYKIYINRFNQILNFK